MLPIKDTIHARSFPVVNWLLIAANSLVFVFQLGLAPESLERFIYAFGLVPARFDWSNPLTYLPVFSHMFMHGGWLHFFSNIWTLYIFGDNVEDRMGSGRYLFFYLLGGVAAGLLQTMLATNPNLPAIGASGAIAAVLGAYLIYFPRAQVITLIPVFVFPWFVNLPAVIFLGFWFVSQLFSGVLSLAMPGGASVGGVAWWAHIGGFLFGLLMALPFAIRRRVRRSYLDEYYPW